MKSGRALRGAVRAALFAALTLLIWRGLNFALTDDVHAYSRVMLEELYGAAGQVKVLFVGSSHCYRSFDPALADEALGTVTFNAGSSQQQPDGSYHMLAEAAAQNELDAVYVETFFTGYNQSASQNIPLACYLLTDYMRPSFNKLDFLWEMGGLGALADDLLPARHSIAAPGELTALWRAKLTDAYTPGNYRYLTYPGEEEYRGKGFVYTYGTPPYGFGTELRVNAAQPVSDFGLRYLDKMTALCAGNGTRMVLVTAPLPSEFAKNVADYQSYIDYMCGYAAANGLAYWDFTLYRDAAELDLGVEDFSDAHHLNGQGADKFTAVFCRVAQQAAAGQDVSGLFYDTLAEKLSAAPDGTLGIVG